MGDSRSVGPGAVWTYEGYWRTVIGDGFSPDPDTRQGLDEWLGAAEAEAWDQGGRGEMPPEWAEHHVRALDALVGRLDHG